MYRCHMEFYLINCQPEVLETLRELPPLEAFNHSFLDSREPREVPLARADVILAAPQAGTESVRALAEGKKESARLILLMDQEQIAQLEDCLPLADEVWTLPMTKKELIYRFTRWQEKQKLRLDLWQTSQFLEATINSTPSLVWYKDKNGIHEKVNDAFCVTVNKTKEQVQGRGHAYIWDVEQDDPACIESERIVMETERTCVSEETVQTGGGVRLLTTYKSPLYDCDGSVMGTVGVAIDITQERSYEQEIVDKNRELENLFTSMDCGVMCHTLDGSRIISMNRAALQILGYDSTEELQDSGFKMIAASVVEEDRPKLRAAIESLTKVGDNVNMEYRVRHSNGEILHVMGNIKLMEENGELFYQRFLLDYTTQRLREERERAENEQRQTELVQALSVDYNLVCHFNLDTGEGGPLRIHDCKFDILDEIFVEGRPIQESLSHYIDRCVYEEDRELVRRAVSPEDLGERLNLRNTYILNYRVLCGGELRYFQMKAVRAGQWENRREVVLGFSNVDDDTRREIERMDLLEDALMQANRANKAKSTFLSNMSHDIRTPMNAVLGFTTLLARDAENPDKVREYTKKITASGQHLLSLINLLSNAVKYTQEGGRIRLRIIGLKQRSSQYEHIRIEVEDNGYGMTPEFLETIFDAFTRAENSTTNKVQGTGLGMAITKSIVELMGGTIEVFSEVDRGSLFRVELELRILEEEADRQFWAQRGVSRVLAAAKDQESRESMAALMEGTGSGWTPAPRWRRRWRRWTAGTASWPCWTGRTSASRGCRRCARPFRSPCPS